ncbi:MAG: NAD(P)H-dependent glycerol-3-phosphate dehydrogenase [Oscillospiraceae bacterium]|nr:NAD(P)H-dependent glycerol-3-phosphate dehydrogenase [Oscillospiraceae bacterium]
MKVSVLGCGRWGSFIAWYLHRIHHDVMLYGRVGSAHLQQFRETRSNGMVTFDESVQFTDSLEEAVLHGEILVISIAAQNLRSLMASLGQLDLAGKTLVLCMKGLEASTGKRLTQVVEEFTSADVAIWVGPGHVQDFTKGIPNCMVIDSKQQSVKERIVNAFGSPLIRFYYGTDLIGNEVGAAAKNVIGIAAGMLDGKGLTALKGALMSRGTREIARLIKAMGGNEITAYGLSHLGDYQATVFSEYSHNRRFGELFVQGKEYGQLAEGVPTTGALLRLAAEHGVELPICNAVDRMVNKGEDADTILSDLFLRSIKEEF